MKSFGVSRETHEGQWRLLIYRSTPSLWSLNIGITQVMPKSRGKTAPAGVVDLAEQ